MSRRFFEQLKSGNESTFLESIRGAASAIKDVGGKMWDEARPAVDVGRSELAAALFSGSSFVMYQSKTDVAQEHDQISEIAEDQRDLGREM